MDDGGHVPARGARVSRRQVLHGGGLAAALAALEMVKRSASVPVRAKPAAPATRSTPPDIQFDIADRIAPVQSVDGIPMQFGPVHTVFATARLLRRPTTDDQCALRDALHGIERAHPATPQGVFTFVGYGLPYFRRLPGGLTGELFRRHVPRLTSDARRFVLEEAVPGPTDVSPRNPGVTKQRFTVPVAIEDNDLLFTFRSDDAGTIQDVLRLLGGDRRLAGLLDFTSSRAMFTQPGLPRKVADQNALGYAAMVNPDSPMWMGFADQHASGSSPAPPITFSGTELSDAAPGDYFDNGSIQHLSHVIMDLQQFYDVDEHGVPGDDGAFTERVQYMFRSTPPPSTGYPDQYTDGGGPAYLDNTFLGTDDALRSAKGVGTPGGAHRLGHLSALHRSSRDRAGRPLHLRMDGPGYDAMDVPDGSRQPKLQFTAFVPTAEFFATMRRHQASLDLAAAHAVPASDNGLERFLTATRRQNFLVPPRRHRAFPLVELC